MGNTPRIKPKPVTDDDIQLWDEFVAEAEPDVAPWSKRLPDGTVLTVQCPTADQITLLADRQAEGDVPGMLTAIFTDSTDTVMTLTGQKAFTVRLKLINDVMFHYGMSLAQLPESNASSS